MIIDFYTILPFTCALFVLLFGLYVVQKDARSGMNQLMLGFCLSMFGWMFGTFMMFAWRTDPSAALFWDRFVYGAVVFMPPFMHHFSLLFTKQTHRQRTLLILNYTLAFLFLLATRTPWFVNGVYNYWWGVHSKAQLLHHVFLGYFFLGTGLFFRNLFLFYRKTTDRLTRLQTLYSFFAFAIVIFIGGSAYLFAYGIDTKFPFSYLSGIIFPVMLFYAVSKHHLLGAKTIVTEVLIGLTEFLMVMQIFFARTLTDIVLRVLFAVGLAIIGYLLMKSVDREVRRREEVTRLARSLEQANLRLQELDKQKTDFLSIAAHQLRTPLSILNGYIELIWDGGYGRVGNKIKDVLDNMEESSGRLVKLVDDFLNITRIEQGRTRYDFIREDITKIIWSVVHELKDRAEQKGLKLIQSDTKKIPLVRMDEEKIRHVIFNFVDNAIKYSLKGNIVVQCAFENGVLTVRVKDHGYGFEKVDQANFFQKFYRGNNVKGINVNGTGLGLYVCSKFIEAHHGKIWAQSPGLGKGSEFGFSISDSKR